jgi:hypothetical protein
MSSIASGTEIDTLSLGSPLPADRPGGGGGSSNSGNTGTGVGLSNPHLSQGRRRTVLDLVNRLHSTGYVLDILPYYSFNRMTPEYSVQVDLDLPQIAVIGSQSAGKSSLIESISGITLPRASGTCTR